MDLIQITPPPRPRLPEWLRSGTTDYRALHDLKVELRSRNLHTVCESARCPNIHECFSRKAATFMILGNICTRRCGFCAVPQGQPEALDADEPRNVAEMAARMGLRYVVITSVNRDELPDGGSRHFARTVTEVRRLLPAARIEVLTPDFLGDTDAVARVLDAGPDVFNHNMETVARLYHRVRPQAIYQRSLDVLRFAKHYRRDVLTKSGLMVGLGELQSEVRRLLRDLRGHDTGVATIGQYLQPTRRRLPVEEFIRPEVFDTYREYGESIGLRAVFSGPLVRSSYMAEQVEEKAGEVA
ncbi:MAG TPA: lipoyl synthase [Bryobacterales bacterium]|nr:lipoyl synthase [Bryobacterales bacterium]